MNDRGSSDAFSDNFDRQVRAMRGRPRRKIPTVSAHVRLDAHVYDAFCRQALQERVSLNVVLQRVLTHALKSSR